MMRLRQCGRIALLIWYGLTIECLQADVKYQDFSSIQGLNLVGQAVQSGNRLHITPSAASNVGGVWASNKQAVQQGFTTTFQYQITDQHPWDQRGSDGFAFVVQNYSPSALGQDGVNLGYNIANSIAVEFDTYTNYSQYYPYISDNASPHVSVQTRGTLTNSPNHIYSQGSTSAIPAIQDGNVHTVRIDYAPGTMAIYMDLTPILSVPINLGNTINLDGGKAWMGFTASTGMGYEAHDILSWSVTEVPEPMTLGMFALGGLVLLRRRKA
jgi:hypothetical protein